MKGGRREQEGGGIGGSVFFTRIHAADMECDHEEKERVKMKRGKDDNDDAWSIVVRDFLADSDDDDPRHKLPGHKYLDHLSKKQKKMPSPRQNEHHEQRKDSECVCVCVCARVCLCEGLKQDSECVCVCVAECSARDRQTVSMWERRGACWRDLVVMCC